MWGRRPEPNSALKKKYIYETSRMGQTRAQPTPCSYVIMEGQTRAQPTPFSPGLDEGQSRVQPTPPSPCAPSSDTPKRRRRRRRRGEQALPQTKLRNLHVSL